jgi:DNA-binding transcriptional MerR regulator
MAPIEQLTVSASAKRVGVGADTIRYYEKAGLLPRPQSSTAPDYRAQHRDDMNPESDTESEVLHAR